MSVGAVVSSSSLVEPLAMQCRGTRQASNAEGTARALEGRRSREANQQGISNYTKRV